MRTTPIIIHCVCVHLELLTQHIREFVLELDPMQKCDNITMLRFSGPSDTSAIIPPVRLSIYPYVCHSHFHLCYF